MKKLLIIALIVLFIAPVAYAEKELQFTGFFKANGTWFDNHALRNDETENSSFYDQDGEFTMKFIADESTYFTFRIEIHDTTWQEPTINAAGIQDADEDITVERAWGTHVFGTKTKLDVGLMTGGTWATAFADDAGGRYRVKVTQPFSENFILVGLLEKMSENYSDVDGLPLWDAEGNSIDTGAFDEGDDWDDYAVGAIIKAGPIAIKPLVYLLVANNFAGDRDLDRLLLDLSISGDLGAIGFETEFANNGYVLDQPDPDLDDNVWGSLGLYLNVWANLDAVKVGGILAWGSWDDNNDVLAGGQGFDFDDDFDSTMLLGDEYGFGGGDDLLGMTLLKLYASIAMGDVTLSPSFAYIKSNQKDFVDADGVTIEDSNLFEDATAWEFDFGFSYKISDVFSYYIDLAYAKISYDGDRMDAESGVEGTDDPDAVMMARHGIKISF